MSSKIGLRGGGVGGWGDPLGFEAPEGRGVARMGVFVRVQGLRGVGKGFRGLSPWR